MRASLGVSLALAMMLAAAVAARGDVVLHWTFDPADLSPTTATDASTYGNDGTLHGAPSQVAGILGGALDFDGSDDYVDVADTASLDLDRPFSVGTWMKTSYAGNWFRALVAKYGYSNITQSWGLGWADPNQLGFYVRDSSGARAMPRAPAGFGLDDQWHHVMGVRGGGTVTLYGDGVPVAQVADTVGGSITNDRPLSVARHHTSTYVPVTLDDVRVYNEGLGPAAVARLFAAGVGYEGAVLSDEPVAYWRMDEASGTTLTDATGNGHSASATNAAFGAPHPLYSDPGNAAVDFGPSNGWAVTDDPISKDDFGGAGDGDYTVELWFNAHSRHQGDLLAFTKAAGGHSLLLELENDGRIRYLHRVPASASGGANIYSAQLYDPGQWNHLVAVREGDLMTLFLNGVQDPVTANFGRDIEDDLDLTFARIDPSRGIRYFNGLMDEVALYDRALSPDEIRMHYYAAIPEPTTVALLALGGLALVRRRRR